MTRHVNVCVSRQQLKHARRPSSIVIKGYLCTEIGSWEGGFNGKRLRFVSLKDASSKATQATLWRDSIRNSGDRSGVESGRVNTTGSRIAVITGSIRRSQVGWRSLRYEACYVVLILGG